MIRRRTFLPDGDGSKLLVLSRPLVGNEQLAVTVEPLRGSLQPTTRPIITGTI